MTAPRNAWLSFFLEALLAALAEGIVAATAWVLRRLYRWNKRKRRRGRPDR